ncbi:MAG: TIGR00159 family protein, partial [Bdellovibrionota bacterium]
RAALGLTEDTDAIVVLVSEEAGEAHLVKNAKITTNLNEQELKQSLAALLDLSRSDRNIPRRMRGWIQAARHQERED